MISRNRTERMKPAVTEDEIRPDLIRIGRRALKQGTVTRWPTGVVDRLRSVHSFRCRCGALGDATIQRPGSGSAVFRQRLAQAYPVSAVTKPFGSTLITRNGRFGKPEDWRLEVSGLVADNAPWTLEKLRSLPSELSHAAHLREGAGARSDNGTVCCCMFCNGSAPISGHATCPSNADGYSTSIDMQSALHPQTILALDFLDKPLAPEWECSGALANTDQAWLQAPRTSRPSP